MKSQRIFLFLTMVSAMALAQSNPVPLINNPLVPDAVAPGGPSFTLTVNGTGFVSGSVINWNGSPLATTFVGGSQLTAIVPAANIASIGTASVAVDTPGVATSNVEFFDLRRPFPAVAFQQSVWNLGEQSPVGLVEADFDDDGNLDVATINGYVTGSVTVMLGNGNGTFQSPQQYSDAILPGGLIAIDVNGDGREDLCFLSYPDGQNPATSVMLGNGDGSFQAPVNTVVGANLITASMASGDFNADGKLDVAITEQSPASELLILLGNGDGSFQTPVAYPAGTSGADTVRTGDFNGDGNLDLAVAAVGDNAVAVFLGNGDGTFQNAVEYSSTSTLRDMTLADVNSDGKLDLVLDVEFAVVVLLGNGDGTFGVPVRFPEGYYVSFSLAMADLNGDNKLDAVGGQIARPTLFTSLGNGDGTFQPRQIFSVPASGGNCCVVAGDFNGDGLLDIAQTDGNSLVLLSGVASVLSATYIEFGTVKAGSRATRAVTISNIGNAPFTINKVKLLSQEPGNWSSTNDCPSSLAAGANCTATIVFKPKIKANYKADLSISNSAINGLQVVSISGIGTD
jgi:hypothetical protein